MREGDKLAELQQILASLPDDLKRLFDVIWTRIVPKYQKEASQYFQMMEAAEQSDATFFCLTRAVLGR